MLRVLIPEQELFDERTQEFINTKSVVLTLEHSLVSISKWEAIYNKPFLSTSSKDDKTNEELLKYIECMTITQNVDPNVYRTMPKEVAKQIRDYISSPLSATTFAKQENKTTSREIITSELIYYWMVSYQIPFECEKWPIQRLMNLIRICSIKNQPPKKMSKSELMSKNSALNAARKSRMNTHG